MFRFFSILHVGAVVQAVDLCFAIDFLSPTIYQQGKYPSVYVRPARLHIVCKNLCEPMTHDRDLLEWSLKEWEFQVPPYCERVSARVDFF